MAQHQERGTCDSCGRVYLVLSAKRTYTCKNCGGVVQVSAERGTQGNAGKAAGAALKRGLDQARARWKLSAAALVALVAAVAAIAAFLGRTKLPEIEPFAVAFVSAWNAENLYELGALFPEPGRDEAVLNLEEALQRREWEEEWPKLAAYESTRNKKELTAELVFAAGETEITAGLVSRETHWELASIGLPPPPVRPAIEAFALAWSSSNPAAIARLFEQELREGMADSVGGLARERGWVMQYPELQGMRTRELTEDRAEIDFQIAAGVLGTTWVLTADERWLLRELRAPE